MSASVPELRLATAEEAATSVVGSIVGLGAALIQHNMLERKSFPYAAKCAEDAAVAYAEMCFPKHEGMDNPKDFVLDPEPTAQPTDPWARMAIERRRPASPGVRRGGKTGSKRRANHHHADDFPSWPGTPAGSRVLSESGSELGGSGKERRSFMRAQRTTPLAPKREQPRSTPLPDEGPPPSEWEERLRADKARKRAERLQKQAEEKRIAEEEAAKEAQWQRKLEAEAERGPCTYDSNGNILWVEELDVEQLPAATHAMRYGVEEVCDVEEASKVGSPLNRSTDSRNPRAAAKAKATSRRLNASKGALKETHKFTDGFHKPLGWQPPIWQIFKPKTGVVLHCDGHILEGQKSTKSTGDRMTRREYEAMVSTGIRPSSACTLKGTGSLHEAGLSRSGTGSMAASRPLSAGQLLAAPVAGGGDGPAEGPLGGTAERSALPQGSVRDLPTELSVAEGGSLATEAADASRARTAPAAPADLWQRARQAEGSLGHRRPPRSRVPRLGSALSLGAAQPPLGATMGHGLLLTAETRPDYYFPSEKMPFGCPTTSLAAASQLRRSSSAQGICVRPGSSGGARRGGCKAPSRPGSAASLALRR